MTSRPPPPKANAARNPPPAAQVQRTQTTAPPAQSTLAPATTSRTAPVPASTASSRLAAPNGNTAGVPPPAAPIQSAPITASPAQNTPAPAILGGGTLPAAAAPSPLAPITEVRSASASQTNAPPPIPPPPIFTDEVNEMIVISDRTTYDQLLNEVGRKHVLVEFFATWCGACMLINRKLEELANSYNGKLIIAKVDVEECEQIALENDVSMMPTFLLMKENQILERFAGSNEEKLMNTIKKYVGEPTNSVEEGNSI